MSSKGRGGAVNRAPNPRRAELAALSATVRPLVKAGAFASVNEAVLNLYSAETGRTDWETFHGWKGKGYRVRKGARGFPIWATPRARKGAPADNSDTNGATDGAEEGSQWFPVAYVFHGGQVDKVQP